MGDDTGYSSSLYSGGSEDDFDELRREIRNRDAEIARLRAEIAATAKWIAWRQGTGHLPGCPQGWDRCKCAAPEPEID